ncbi:hypothetical protein MMC18_002668 [Xylographa bjoerkii]|nr:hypothetical protein [Xylographa bjoerkii]
MDDLLPQLLSFPPHPPPLQKLSDYEYHRQIKALAHLLHDTSASKLVKGVAGGGDLLDVRASIFISMQSLLIRAQILDPAINTLPYLYTLLAHIGGTQEEKQSGNSLLKVFSPGGQLWQKMLDFVQRFDPVQVRYAGHEWRRLLEKVARVGDLSNKPMAMPKTTSSHAARTYRAIAKPYDTLAEAFKDGNGEKLYAELQAAQQIWQKDCNMGLVLQVLNAFRRFLILKLEKTYAALPISLVAQQTSPQPSNIAETESYLTSLIASGQLNATLVPSAETSVLRFASTSHDGPLARSEMQNFQDLQMQTEKFSYLTRHIKDTERRLELSKEYLEWARKNQKSKDAGAGTANPGTTGNSGYGVDEDMLADM